MAAVGATAYIRVFLTLFPEFTVSEVSNHYRLVERHHELRMALQGRVFAGETIRGAAVSDLFYSLAAFGHLFRLSRIHSTSPSSLGPGGCGSSHCFAVTAPRLSLVSAMPPLPLRSLSPQACSQLMYR